MLPSHLYLGFPCDLFVRGFHLNIFLTVLVSGILNDMLFFFSWRYNPNRGLYFTAL